MELGATVAFVDDAVAVEAPFFAWPFADAPFVDGAFAMMGAGFFGGSYTCKVDGGGADVFGANCVCASSVDTAEEAGRDCERNTGA